MISATPSCPRGWTSYGGSCYVIIQKYLDWFEGKIACETVGGSLAEIETAGENKFLTDLLNRGKGGFASSAAPTIPRMWIGLYDFIVELDFVWVSTRYEPDVTHWASGEPNNNGDEDCGELEYTGFWNDEDCERKIWTACEMELRHEIYY
ncbi:lectin BRA-3-like [Littorina saxatilis]|uniref:lectin BRA-3-like n=1 Tax=Littorina saxatilis TaxID=31220 RepID=UPI0038B58101